MLEQKQLENSWEVEKRNPSVELEKPYLEKVVRKSVALAKTILTKKMCKNQSSQFRYGAVTNSSLEIFD